jgi:hypothetical protein
MAQTMITNNYNVLPVLDELFKSEHFYDVSLRGSIIRGPLEMLMGMMNPTESVPNYTLTTNSDLYLTIYALAEGMGQAYAAPPSVAGWPVYYQSPAFSKLWINSTTIKSRFDYAAAFTILTGIPAGSNFFKVNALGFVDGLSNPSDAIQVIDDICDVFFPKAIDAAQKLVLKGILTNGLPDFEWTLQYNDYIGNPGNTAFSDPVKIRIQLVLNRVFKMPEFQTI